MSDKKRTRKRIKLQKTESKAKRPLTARLMRTFLVYGTFFLLLTGILFYIQVIKGPSIQKSALGQWTRTTTVSADRGEILDSTGKVLATNGKVYKVLLWPQQIAAGDGERIAAELSKLLNLEYGTVLKRCQATNYQEIVIKRQIDSSTRDAVENLKLGAGVGTALDSKRYYPMGSLLSQVIGFTNVDNAGQSGLELSYNEYLAGTDGKQVTETDNRGNPIPYGTTDYVEPIDGLDLHLTCDSEIQRYLEKALAEAMEVNNAASAQGIVMDCRNGAILALSSQPDYDPNDPPRNDRELLDQLTRDRLVTDVYEPGSTFKILTLASALDSGAADTFDSFYCAGSYRVGSEKINCWKHSGHGTQSLTQAAENSCNCAFMRMALTMGKEKFYDYLYAFGLGRSTESGLLGETGGIVTHEKYVTDNDLARIGFGQSIAVTPLQLCTAVCAAVNGGELYQPHIIASMTDGEGSTVFEANTEPVRRVISEETSRKVRQILQSVVDNGTGRNCKIEGYSVGGKTGTAQKYDEYGRVAEGKYICSFIGFAPADDPRYVCLILVDEPQVASVFGSTVAAPFVREVLENTLHYAGMRPAGGSVTVEVPELIGKTREEAEALLEEAGLVGVFQSSDEITAQVPAAGESVPAGFEVLLYTGIDDDDTGKPPKRYVTVPDLIGMTPLEAYDTLTAAGLEMVTDSDDPAGEAYMQDISKDNIVEYGRKIKVFFRIKPASGD